MAFGFSVLAASPSVLALLVLAVGVCAGMAVWLLGRVLSGLAARTKGDLDDEMGKRLPLPIAVLVGIVATALTLNLVASQLDAGHVSQARHLLAVLFVVTAAWGVVRLLRFTLERAGRRRARFQPATRVAGRLVSVVLYALAFLTVLSEYGISITPLLTGLGIAALAVALALQDTMSNFFAGLWIQTGRPLQPGHYVKLEEEEGLEGYVEEVGWRVTRIRTLDGNTVVAPNSKLAQAIVTDFDLPDREMSIVLPFRAAFDADPDLVMRVLVEEGKEAAKGNPGIVPTVEPFAQLVRIGEDANHFELILRVTEFVQQFKARHELRLRVLRRFRAENIVIPFPTRHNLQEAVRPKAERGRNGAGASVPAAARKRRASRPKAHEPEPAAALDPREAEAEKAKEEIAAKQREQQQQQQQSEPPKPEEPVVVPMAPQA